MIRPLRSGSGASWLALPAARRYVRTNEMRPTEPHRVPSATPEFTGHLWSTGYPIRRVVGHDKLEHLLR